MKGKRMTKAMVAPVAGTKGAGEPLREAPAPVEFRYTQTESFVALLQQLGASLLVSTYQANKLLAVRAAPGGLSTLVRTFEKPMGIAVDGGRLALGTRNAVWLLRNAPDIAPQLEPAGQHDACFLPRSCHVTGDIGVHEIAWAGGGHQESGVRGQAPAVESQRPATADPFSLTPDPCLLTPDPCSDELWLVSTRFSCLCTLHADYSFVPRWRPRFISAFAAEDRCHLNGLAVVDGRPKYVTALGESDTADGWRANKPQGGCLIDVDSGAIISRGMSMPHSPRWHQGRLWLLESGKGRLVLVDAATGRRQTVAELPGFTRGLAMCGPYAFVGLSKIRATSAMDGVPLAERRDELKCGVAAVDIHSGQVIAFLEFQTAVEEIFDVQVLPGLRFPEVIGFQQETIQHTFIVPPENPPSTGESRSGGAWMKPV
jgi:hypothetical protein